MPIDTHQGTAPREGTSVASLVGDTPLVRLRRLRDAAGRRDPREARVAEPRRLGEGPRGARDGRRRRAARARSARPGPARRDVRQHRHRLRDARRGARLPREAVRAGQRHARAEAAAARLRRGPRADRSDGRQRRRHPRGAADLRARSRTLLLPRSVQQRRQLARALRDDGRRDPRADRRPRDALRRGPRHERHVRRHRPAAARVARPGVELVSVQPDSPLHGLEGLKHMASAIVPGIYDPSLADDDLRRRDRRRARDDAALARDAGLLVGPSSGAALAACLEVARDTRPRASSSRSFPTAATATCPSAFWRAGPGARWRLPREVARRDSRARRRRLSGRVLRRAARPARRRGRAKRCRSTTRTDSKRRRRFLVGPTTTAAPSARGGRAGLEIVGFYHSHPDHPAEPSAVRSRARLAEPELRDRLGPRRPCRASCDRGGCGADRSGYDEESLTLRRPSMP